MAIKRETMCRCEKCGEVMAWDERKRVPNGGGDVGEDWYECPYCGFDSLAEVAQCDVCGQYFEPDEISFGMCPDCLRKEARNVRQVLEYGEAHKTEAKLNAVLMKAFTERQINDLVMNAFVNLPDEVQRKAAVDCADDDLMAYAEFLKKEEWI